MCMCATACVLVGGGVSSKIPLPALWSLACTSPFQNKQLQMEHRHTVQVNRHDAFILEGHTGDREGTLPLQMFLGHGKTKGRSNTWHEMEMEHIAYKKSFFCTSSKTFTQTHLFCPVLLSTFFLEMKCLCCNKLRCDFSHLCTGSWKICFLQMY